MEHMIGTPFRASFVKSDELGVVHFTRDVRAVDGCKAIDQVRWLLLDEHPDDGAEYSFEWCKAISRTEPAEEIEGAPA